MGTITRSFANHITTSGLLLASAVQNSSFDNVSSVPSGSVTSGDMQLLTTTTASAGTSSISFTSGISSTYKEYIFLYNNIHCSNLRTNIQFQCSIDSGSNYNLTITSSFFQLNHQENGSNNNFGYITASDQAQGTGYQTIGRTTSDDNDGSHSGLLRLYDPANTTFVKHFMAWNSAFHEAPSGDYHDTDQVSGYFNTTSAIDAIQFKPEAGTFEGTIQMFGVN